VLTLFTRVQSGAERSALREGARTAAVLAIAAAVAVAAAADAFRGGHSQAPPPPPPAHAAALPRPPHGSLHGSLWYADAGCHLHRLDLATGRDRTLTRTPGHCHFWVSPNRRLVAMHSGRPFIPPEDIELLDVATGRVTTPFHRPDLAFAPPVWSPDSRTLVVCDGDRGPPDLRAYHLGPGTVTTPATFACFPGYVGARLAYRDLDSVTRLAGRKIADAGTITDVLRQGIYQEPAPAAAGDVVAVSGTTVTPAGGPPPITTVVLFDAAGHVVGSWDTGAIADSVTLLAGGRVIVVSRRAGLVVDDRRTRAVVASAAGRPIVSAAVAPDAAGLALADGRRIVFTDMRGRPRFALPIRTGWIQWTR
jgi:hypothetical protein